MYLVVAKSRPGIVQTVNPPRQMLMAGPIAAATGYLFYTTATYCQPGDRLPTDAAPFGGFVDPTVSSTGAVTVATATAAAMSLKGDKGDPGTPGGKGDPGAPGGKGDPGPKGDPAVLPVSMHGSIATGPDGKAKLDWSALKLAAAPSSLIVNVVGKPMPWCCDADPTATGVTVSVQAEKPAAVLSLSVDLAGGQPAVGVRLLWSVTA